MRKLLIASYCALTVALTGTLAQAADDPLKLKMCWTASGSDAPFFLGLDRGYFKDERIQLEITEILGSAACFKIMASGEFPIALPDFGALTKAVAAGMPVKAVYGIFVKTTSVIVSRADKPVKSPKDLEGKMIAMGPSESTALLFPALAVANSVDRSKITFVHPADGAKMALFMNNNVDAMTAALNLQVPVMESRGAKLQTISYADFGVNVMSNGIAVNTDWLAKNEDLTRRFLRAVTKSWAASEAEPDAAIKALIKFRPAEADQFQVFLQQLKLTFPLLHTDNTKGKPLGWMSDKDWEGTRDLMVKYTGLEKPEPIEKYFTNAYVPQ